MSDRRDTRFARHLVPSEDWELNVMLLKIATSLDQAEFNRLKFLCSGYKGIQKRVLDRFTTPELFFVYLKEQAMISKDNLLLLQAFLNHLEKEDLWNLVADYAKRRGDILHISKPNPEPAEGFAHIQFHLEGNLDSFQRPELEALRANVACLLFVPEQYVIMQGVEPSGSLTLTFMIHKDEAGILKEVFKDHKDSFGRLGVDGIFIDNSEYLDPTMNLRRRGSVPAGAATQEQLQTLYEHSLRLESRVEESEIRSLESRADAILARQEAREWRRKENYFRCLLARIVEQQNVPRAMEKRRSSIQVPDREDTQDKSPLQIGDVELIFPDRNDREAVPQRPSMRRGSLDIF